MILGEAVTKIANRYGYDAFDNLDEIRDDDLKEAVETVYLARCFCTTVPASRLYMLVRDNRISFIKLVLETRCSMSHLKNQLIKYDWGREYLQRHLYEFSLARKGMRT